METIQQFYENQRIVGNTENITGNPNPDYSLPFYQTIFSIMESYAEQKCREQKDACISAVGLSGEWIDCKVTEALCNTPLVTDKTK